MRPHFPRAWLITPHAPQEIFNCYASISPDDLIVAVDGGYARCLELGLKPRIAIGDFDSIPPQLLEKIPSECEIIAYPTEKDDTDTTLAVQYCIQQGVLEIFICNDLMGRFDHSLALIQNLGLAQVSGVRCSVVSRTQLITLIDKDMQYTYPQGTIISLLSATPECSFSYSRGLQYPLDDLSVYNWQARCISNVVTAGEQIIGISSGTAMIIITLP